MLTTLLKSFDTIVIFATTSTSITVSVTGNSLIGIPKGLATTSGLSFGNKVIYEIIMQK